MTFAEQLDTYMTDLGCTANELSAHCKVSESTISRYRSGGRTPKYESSQVNGLVEAFLAIAGDRDRSDEYTEESIRRAFRLALLGVDIDVKEFAGRLDALLKDLKISVAKTAPAIGYDASYISRMRKGQRFPADVTTFIGALADWIAANCNSSEDVSRLVGLLSVEVGDLSDEAAVRAAIVGYLGVPNAEQQENEKRESEHKADDHNVPEEHDTVIIAAEETEISPTAEKAIDEETSAAPMLWQEEIHSNWDVTLADEMDSFRVQEYLQNNLFDGQLPGGLLPRGHFRKIYTGEDGWKCVQMDFAECTIRSASKEDVWIFGDLWNEELDEDETWRGIWIYYLNRMIQKGLHIHILSVEDAKKHDADGLIRQWLPLLMTGRLHIYRPDFKGEGMFCHMLLQSGACVADGYCVDGDIAGGNWVLVSTPKDMMQGRVRMREIFDRARPLMDVYGEGNGRPFLRLLIDSAEKGYDFTRILPQLPLFTMPVEMFDRMIMRSGVDEECRQRLLLHHKRQVKLARLALKNGTVNDRFYVLPEEEFREYPQTVATFGFVAEKIVYTYEEYREHLAETERFAGATSGYTIDKLANVTAESTSMVVAGDSWTAILKEDEPPVRFVAHSEDVKSLFKTIFWPNA